MTYQRGANGLVAEHVCVLELNRHIIAAGVESGADLDELSLTLSRAEKRVADDLTPEQLLRARNQGTAIAEYISHALFNAPDRLGLRSDAADLRNGSVTADAVGNLTNSGTSADIVIWIRLPGQSESTPLLISLKAYRGTVSSLGSKGARASLTRVFLGVPKVSDDKFQAYFGIAAVEFDRVLTAFKAAAKDFYESSDGIAFVDAYEDRKKTRKVNNPLRRKEVGDYFAAVHGFKSEHRFAELYAEMFTIGRQNVKSPEDWARFLEGMRFLLGMDSDILTLNAIASDDGNVKQIVNSLESDAYADIRKVLVPGCHFILTSRPNSSGISVRVQHGELEARCLTLAMWKDATIQFKLDTRGDT